MTALPQIARLDTPAEAAELVFSHWQRNYGSRDWYRSRARTCWHEARTLARYLVSHGWLLNQDQAEQIAEERRDLRIEAAEYVRQSRRVS